MLATYFTVLQIAGMQRTLALDPNSVTNAPEDESPTFPQSMAHFSKIPLVATTKQ